MTRQVYAGTPVIVRDYPKQCKAFYMRLNEGSGSGGAAGETVAAMDVLVPRVGELMGGSQREERLAVLEKRLTEQARERPTRAQAPDSSSLMRQANIPSDGASPLCEPRPGSKVTALLFSCLFLRLLNRH